MIKIVLSGLFHSCRLSLGPSAIIGNVSLAENIVKLRYIIIYNEFLLITFMFTNFNRFIFSIDVCIKISIHNKQ